MALELSDEELAVIIGLVNKATEERRRESVARGIVPLAAELSLYHQSNQGSWRTLAVPLVRKLLREAIRRGVMEMPSCFTGDL